MIRICRHEERLKSAADLSATRAAARPSPAGGMPVLQTPAGAERRVPDVTALAPFSAELARAQICNLSLELQLSDSERKVAALTAQVAQLTEELNKANEALIVLTFADNRTRREVARSVEHKANKHRRPKR